MSNEAFSVRADAKTIKRLDKLTKQLDRSRNYVVNQAIGQLLELHAWQDEQVQVGMHAADQGQFASEPEMERIFNKYREAE